jgi:hypothetical protein
MSTMTQVVLAAVVSVTCVASAAAQSLGDIARKEESRRTRVAPGKQYSDDDLLPAAPPRALSSESVALPGIDDPDGAGPEAAAVASPDGESAESADPPVKAREKRDEAYWRGRATELREAVARIRGDLEMAEARLAELDGTESSPSLTRERQVTANAFGNLQRNLQSMLAEAAAFEKRAKANNIPAEWIQ